MATIYRTLTIADAGTTSDYLRVEGGERGSIGPLPTDWTTADLSQQATNTVDADGAPTGWVTITTATSAAAADLIEMDSQVFSHRFFRILSGAAQNSGPLEIPVFVAGYGE